MGKRNSTVPAFEDYKAPWEVDADGNDIPEEDQQLEAARLKKYLHGLLTDKDAAQGREAAEKERANQLQSELDEARRKSETDEERRQREEEERRRQAGDSEAEKLARLKLEVALDVDGITAKQAKLLAARLTGTTKEELEADAESVIETWGLPGKDPAPEGDDHDEGDERGEAVRRRPRQVRTQGDPAPDTAPRRSFEEELSEIPRPGGHY